MSGKDPPRLARGDALFLDFDGTLAEIGPDPDAITLPAGAAALLDGLAAALGEAVAVISGRGLADLAGRVPAGLWRIGAHGLEVAPPGAAPGPPPPPPPEAVLRPLREAARRPGVRLEIKGPVAALHYRAAPSAGAACLAAAEAARAAVPDLVVQPGKMVVEVKPAAASKGRALARMMRMAPFAGRRPVAIGDDATDEDAMAAAMALGGIGVKVGEGPSRAGFRLADPARLRAWLAAQLAALRAGPPPAPAGD